MERHRRAHAGLLPVGCDHGHLADSGKAASGSPQPRSVYTIIIGEKDFQRIASQVNSVDYR
jgi:hypothetical protein